jgi:hypothetical protein
VIDRIDYYDLPIRFFSSDETRDKIRLLIKSLVKDYEPDVIFCPGIKETMQDRQATTEEITRITRSKASIFGYETSKHNRFFNPTMFINVSEEDIDSKIKSVNAFQEFTNRYYFNADAIRSLSV